MLALSAAASASSILFYTSLLWQAWQVHRRQHTEGGQLHSALCAYFNAALWCKYGLLVSDTAVFAVNAVGMASSMLFLSVIYRHTPDKGGVDRVLWRMLTVFAGFGYAVYDGWLEAGGVGRTAAIMSIAVFFSPTVSLYKQMRLSRFPDLNQVIVSGDDGAVQTAIAGAVSCALWSAYGYGQSDRWIIIPNVIGLLLSLLQLLIITHSRPQPTINHKPAF